MGVSGPVRRALFFELSRFRRNVQDAADRSCYSRIVLGRGLRQRDPGCGTLRRAQHSSSDVVGTPEGSSRKTQTVCPSGNLINPGHAHRETMPKPKTDSGNWWDHVSVYFVCFVPVTTDHNQQVDWRS